MTATMPRPEVDPAFVAGGATDTELAAAVAGVNTALAAKQDSSTAATDAELTDAVATLNALLATKQDSATAATDADVTAAIAAHAAGDATDAELAAAVATLNASLATKQDAATASTDAERDAAIAAALAGLTGPPTYRLVVGFDTARQNTSGKAAHIGTNCGVISDPGENGHIYLEISPDNVDWTTYARGGPYVACRNTIENLSQIASAGFVWGFVPAGWWFRYRTYVASGYAPPDFVFDSGFEFVRSIG